jgi:hypothetical protein
MREKGSDGARTPIPNGPMQWRDATLVDSVGICACADEIGDRVVLRALSRIRKAGSPVCGVVERCSSPSVVRVDGGTVRNESSGEVALEGGCGDMQRRVPRVDVMGDGRQKVRLGILAAGSDPQ